MRVTVVRLVLLRVDRGVRGGDEEEDEEEPRHGFAELYDFYAWRTRCRSAYLRWSQRALPARHGGTRFPPAA